VNRRAFVTGLGAVLAAPLTAEAQEAGKVHRIGLFHVGLDHVPPSLDGIRDGLKTLGYEEGKSVRLDFPNLADEGRARRGDEGGRRGQAARAEHDLGSRRDPDFRGRR